MKNNLVMFIIIFVVVLFNSLVYGALNSNIFINGEAHVRVDRDVRITSFSLLEQVGGAYEVYNSDYSKDSTSLQVVLPNNYAKMVYEVTVTNRSSSDVFFISLIEDVYSNHNVNYEIVDLAEGDKILAGDTIKFKIKLSNVSNDSSNCMLAFKYVFMEKFVYSFNYTGDVQEFTANVSGLYKLEVWGAQGGSVQSGGKGGKGGYSVGVKQLRAGEKLYVYVGEQGQNRAIGAFNGGGACYCVIHGSGEDAYVGQGGGGASDIRTTKNDKFLDRIIVAGGGGGGIGSEAGYGGGEVAGSAYAYLGIRNTYAADGAQGGNCAVLTGGCASNNCETSWGYTSLFTGGGGGGYVGGVGIHSNTNSPSPNWGYHLIGSAAGGTGYVGGVESSETYGIVASTIGGNLEIPTHDGLSVMIGNSGNGYAKITFISKL